jgi:hypothetical protein
MVFPADARRWIGTLIVLDWRLRPAETSRTIPSNSGGRVLRVDDTYLYLQPFGLPGPSKPGETVTHLRLQIDEERIPLVDIDEIYAAPLEGIIVDE